MNAGLFVALAGLALTACGGVSHSVRGDVPVPTTIAVLPFAGPAPAGLRDAARQLLHSRIQVLGYQTPELAWIDRVLTERGWLDDPNRFEPERHDVGALAQALGVDAVLAATAVDESSFNLVLLRRHAFAGRFAVHDAAGRGFWTAEHGASTFGGFLLTSGQVFTELRAQGEHGTPMASLALVDELVADVVGTLPERARQTVGTAPVVGGVTLARRTLADGSERVVVEADLSPGAHGRCDLVPVVLGAPMAPIPDAARRQRVEVDVAAGVAITAVVVHARDAFGRTARAEGAR